MAEITALLHAAQAMVSVCQQRGWGATFIGDSKLVVDFCARTARPSHAPLFLALAELNLVFRQLCGNFCVTHVPREQNRIADWLSKIGLEGVSGDLQLLCRWMQPHSTPVLPVPAAVAYLIGSMHHWVGERVTDWLPWWESVCSELSLGEALGALATVYEARRHRRHVLAIRCPSCGVLLIDTGVASRRPRTDHVCHRCGHVSETEAAVLTPALEAAAPPLLGALTRARRARLDIGSGAAQGG